MSAPPPATTPAEPTGRGRLAAPLVDAAVVAGWFVVAGLVGAVVWWQVAPLPKVTKTGETASLAPEELVKQVGIDGWFVVIAVVGGLLSGILLLAWRHRDPLLMVVLVVLGGGLASWLMVHVGRLLGPGDEIEALRRLSDGAVVSQQLRLHAPGAAWTWAIAAAFGALVWLWVLAKPTSRSESPDILR